MAFGFFFVCFFLKNRGALGLVVWGPLSWDADRRGMAGSRVCWGGFMVVQGSALYLSDIVRAPVREGRSLAFPCAEQGSLCRLSL